MVGRLVPIIEATPHRAFVDLFGGGGSVFFSRRARKPMEVFNDRDGDLITTLRVVRDDFPALVRAMAWDVASRAEFDRLKAIDGATLNPIERARRFLFIQFNGFAGKPTAPCFGRSAVANARWTTRTLHDRLAGLHRRLARVYVEDKDAVELIGMHDRADTLFFVDPPYPGADRYYRSRFGEDDHRRLADALRRAGARFLLTLPDTPEVRALYAWAGRTPIPTRYSAGGGGGRRVTELLIANFQLPDIDIDLKGT